MIAHRAVAALLAALLLPACTAGAPGGPAATPAPSPRGGPAPITLPVVASLSGPTAASDRTYLDGMRLAVRVFNRAGGAAGRPLRLDVLDDRGADARGLIEEALSRPGVPAVLVVGPGDPLAALRQEVERSRAPVLLFAGDLYSSRRLFRQVFQVSPPLRWQATVLARYLVLDRMHRSVAVVTVPGDEAPYRAVADALAEEGAPPPDRVLLRSSASGAARDASSADAV
ncbi:MAG TPA: ABC transporter substrate-binding protein, partial [Actinomycetota bacterium]|nr:ABC transporter substrate-binding protein [Actinomycetota bacterium]